MAFLKDLFQPGGLGSSVSVGMPSWSVVVCRVDVVLDEMTVRNTADNIRRKRKLRFQSARRFHGVLLLR
ncbi:SET domain-containing protein [Pycnococcus provasolii]